MDDIELVAGFMAYERKQGKQLASYKSGGDSWYYVGDNFTELESYYIPNQNWNHLIPAWFKFRDLRFDKEIDQFRHSHLKDIISHAICYEDIHYSFHKLLIAIQWYNSIQSNNNPFHCKVCGDIVPLDSDYCGGDICKTIK